MNTIEEVFGFLSHPLVVFEPATYIFMQSQPNRICKYENVAFCWFPLAEIEIKSNPMPDLMYSIFIVVIVLSLYVTK